MMTESTINTNNEDQVEIPTPISSTVPLGTTEKKTPFADGPLDLSGMTTSVLNPKTEKERAVIEKEFAKRREHAQHGERSFSWQVVLVLCVILFGIVLGIYKVAITGHVPGKNLVIGLLNTFQRQELKIIADNGVVLESNFRLTVRTTKLANRLVVVYGQNAKEMKRAEAKVIARNQRQELLWAVDIQDLKKGSYLYKYYAKNIRTGKYVIGLGKFEI